MCLLEQPSPDSLKCYILISGKGLQRENVKDITCMETKYEEKKKHKHVKQFKRKTQLTLHQNETNIGLLFESPVFV